MKKCAAASLICGVGGLQHATVFEKGLWHQCFLVNLANFQTYYFWRTY